MTLRPPLMLRQRAMTLRPLLLLLLRAASALAPQVNYFAFGSNTHRAVLSERRGIRPLALARGRVEDYRLAFNLRGFSDSEPSFASIEPAPGDEVHGVVYRLAPLDWLRLCATEAAGVSYSVEKVAVRVYDEDRRYESRWGTPVVEALTLRTKEGPWRVDREEDEPTPSRRYLGLLREGAQRRGLAPAWQRKLDLLLENR